MTPNGGPKSAYHVEPNSRNVLPNRHSEISKRNERKIRSGTISSIKSNVIKTSGMTIAKQFCFFFFVFQRIHLHLKIIESRCSTKVHSMFIQRKDHHIAALMASACAWGWFYRLCIYLLKITNLSGENPGCISLVFFPFALDYFVCKWTIWFTWMLLQITTAVLQWG